MISAGRLVTMQWERQAGGGTASLASATAREIAMDGPVWTTILPVASILSGKRSMGRGAGLWCRWVNELVVRRGAHVAAGSHAAAAVAHHAGVPVWVVAGVGRVLPQRMWEALTQRLDEGEDEP